MGGKKYKKDQSTGKANSKLAKGLKKVKKQKPLHKRKKTVNGHVHLGLESKANKALKRGAKSANGGSIATQLKLYKSKLYLSSLRSTSTNTLHALRSGSRKEHTRLRTNV